MEENQNSPSVSDLRNAARALGLLAAEVGDFYDVAEEFAMGYALGNLGNPVGVRGRMLQLQLGALNELQSVANSVIEWRVDDARELRMSWQEIADPLDISRQAAQQKYGK